MYVIESMPLLTIKFKRALIISDSSRPLILSPRSFSSFLTRSFPRVLFRIASNFFLSFTIWEIGIKDFFELKYCFVIYYALWFVE